MSPNLHWTDVPLKALISRRLKYRISVENDANMAAWAAYVVEAKRRVQNLLCVTVGTGVGGGLIINGKLYRGTTGSAGEIGHLTLYPEGVPCPCGNQGCLERYVGALAMAAEARQAIESGEKSIITKLVQNNLARITPLILTQAARQHDKLALHLWNQVGERLGIGLAGIDQPLLIPDGSSSLGVYRAQVRYCLTRSAARSSNAVFRPRHRPPSW